MNIILNNLRFQVPLSDEQGGIVVATLGGKSVAVDAGAGSGKSHTAHCVAKNEQGNVESIPFMVALRTEEERAYAAHPNVKTSNFHQRGKRLCGNCEVDEGKLYGIVNELGIEENGDGIAMLAGMLKAEAYGLYDAALDAKAVAEKYSIDTELVPDALKVLARSDAMTNVVDFADMLRMPVLLGRKQTLQGRGILDEVQDYTPASWLFIRECLTTRASKVLMIGDPQRQCLMSFAGANAELFEVMANHFGCERHKLTVNRRCAKRIVDNAPFKGDMVALPDAPDGEVTSMPTSEALDAISEGQYATDAILSEVNAPLVELGISLLTKNVPCQMRAKKLQSAITRVAYKYLDQRSFPFPSSSIAEAIRKDAREANEATATDTSREDIINCIASLEAYCVINGIVKTSWVRYGRKCRPLHPILQALNKLLTSNEGITLLTGHTAKGLEWETVFHLPGNAKAPEQDWQVHQANCLAHVIATRPKLRLVTLS